MNCFRITVRDCVLNLEVKWITIILPLVLIKISPALGRGMWKSSILRDLPGSQNTAARMLEGPFPKWYPLASLDRNRPSDAVPADKRPNSLRKAGKKRERAAMRDLCRSSDRSTAGVVLPPKSDSFVFLYSVGQSAWREKQIGMNHDSSAALVGGPAIK